MKAQAGFEIVVSMAVAMSLAVMVLGSYSLLSHGSAFHSNLANIIQQSQTAMSESIPPGIVVIR